jgi:hypothetical protein
MAEWSADELRTLRHVIAKAEQDPDFSAAEVADLKAIAEAFRGLRLFGKMSRWVIFLLAALAGAIAAWDQIIARFTKQ